jgi:hypothetical protein
MTAPLVWLGLLLGIRHAMEADHLAAVASLASRGGRARELVRVAGAWGLGHSATLLAAGAVLVWSGAVMPARLGHALELVAGAVLVWLGLDVLRRAARPVQMRGGTSLASRAMVVGGLHGLEGSGAVVLLVLPSVRAPAQGLAYLCAFGAGTIAGMVGCSLALTLPLGVAAARVHRGLRALQLAVGAASLTVGVLALRPALDYIRSIFT